MGHYFLVKIIIEVEVQDPKVCVQHDQELKARGFLIYKWLSYFEVVYVKTHILFFFFFFYFKYNYYTTINIFGEYTYTFVIHKMYDILVVDMLVYDMQVWLVVFCLKFL